MFFIHHTALISAQKTFAEQDINTLIKASGKQMVAIEPSYSEIPSSVLRRMGKGVRMGVGAALPVLACMQKVDGIIIGTANSGKEDSVKFLNQIVEYYEGMLTPMNFVQSTPNAVAAQIGLLTNNHGYNITHLHGGLAFEFAMIDADMLLKENPGNSYLLGSVDEISLWNYYFEDKAGWYKKEDITGKELYMVNSSGSISGEAAAMFQVSLSKENAVAAMLALDTLHSNDDTEVKQKLELFIKQHLPEGEQIDLLLSGENGDNRFLKYYTNAESLMGEEVLVARFKHISGEFPTAIAMGLWVGCQLLQSQQIPVHLIKKQGTLKPFKNMLLYNNYKGMQHSFILLSDVRKKNA